MDELTLDGQTYVSSKRAAQITGYAKDYVGQLCREGRVDARQVGRNWYVLETSIREHRFGADVAGEITAGAENEVSGPHTETSEISLPVSEITSSPISAWENPKYSVVTAPELPALGDREEESVPVVVTHEIEEDQPGIPSEIGLEALMPESHKPTEAIVEEMQSAWKDWFTSKPMQVSKPIHEARATELHAERSEMPHMRAEEVVEAFTEYEEETVPVAITRPQASVQRHQVHSGSFDIAPTAVKGSVSDVNEEVAHEERVSVTRTHSVGMPSESAALRQMEDIMPARIVHERIVNPSRAGVRSKSPVQKVVRQGRPVRALQALFVFVAVVAMATAWIGTGYAANVLGTNVQSMQPIRYISGAISFNRDSGV